MKHWNIWMEGYIATGEHGESQKINDEPILAETFDDAVLYYMSITPEHGIEVNSPARYISQEAYNNRKSNWNIWACNLYPTKEEASYFDLKPGEYLP